MNMKTYKVTVVDKYGDKVTYGDVTSHNIYVDVKGESITNYYSVRLTSGVVMHGSFIEIKFH